MKEISLSKKEIVVKKELSEKFISNAAKEKWGNGIGSVVPSHSIKVGDEIKFFISEQKVEKNQSDCFEFIEKNNLLPCNVYGLVYIEHLDKISNFIPIGTILVGYDYAEHLHIKKRHQHIYVPFMKKIADGVYQHGTFSASDNHDADEVMVVLKVK